MLLVMGLVFVELFLFSEIFLLWRMLRLKGPKIATGEIETRELKKSGFIDVMIVFERVGKRPRRNPVIRADPRPTKDAPDLILPFNSRDRLRFRFNHFCKRIYCLAFLTAEGEGNALYI